MKNKIISLNLPDALREKLNNLVIYRGKTINELLIAAIEKGIDYI